MVGNNMNGEINWIVCACVNAWCVWIQCIRMVCVCYYCHKNRVGWSTISNAVRCVLYSFQFFFSFIYIFCFLYFDSCRPVIRFCLNCILFYLISLHYYHHRMHRWHICCCFRLWLSLSLFLPHSRIFVSRLSISILHHLSLSINYWKLLFL